MSEEERYDGASVRKRADGGGGNVQRRAYFAGRLAWAEGFDGLLELEESYRERTGEYFEIDIYCSGPDDREI